jgi:hypothetical protein
VQQLQQWGPHVVFSSAAAVPVHAEAHVLQHRHRLSSLEPALRRGAVPVEAQHLRRVGQMNRKKPETRNLYSVNSRTSTSSI